MKRDTLLKKGDKHMADMTREQERNELHRAIWAMADELRGSIGGWEFKSYVLGTMFYRYISENLTNYINAGEIEAGNADFDYAKLSDEEAEEARDDMYPLYWTPSRGGIIMRYTYEYKRKCVELYREGKWPETPEGVSDKSFRDKVRLWVRAEDSRGPEALKHKNFNRNWTPEERLELVSQVMSGKSCVSVAIEAGIQDRLLYQWVQNYKTKGYNGLVEMKKGRPSKGVSQMKKEEARPLNESEREELIRLRAENEYIKAENEVIKKEIALREERHAAQLKARKQRSSKSCVKKDTN